MLTWCRGISVVADLLGISNTARVSPPQSRPLVYLLLCPLTLTFSWTPVWNLRRALILVTATSRPGPSRLETRENPQCRRGRREARVQEYIHTARFQPLECLHVHTLRLFNIIDCFWWQPKLVKARVCIIQLRFVWTWSRTPLSSILLFVGKVWRCKYPLSLKAHGMTYSSTLSSPPPTDSDLPRSTSWRAALTPWLSITTSFFYIPPRPPHNYKFRSHLIPPIPCFSPLSIAILPILHGYLAAFPPSFSPASVYPQPLPWPAFSPWRSYFIPPSIHGIPLIHPHPAVRSL